MEKRTGKLLYETAEFQGGPFHAVDVDAATGRIELVAPQAKIVIAAEEPGPKAPGK